MTPRDLPGLERIAPSALTQYLRAAGWSQGPVDDRVASFHRVVDVPPSDDPDLPKTASLAVEVPLKVAFADYPRRLAEVVELLADVERRPPLQVLHDLLTPPADIARFRVVSEATQAGNLPIQLAIGLRQTIQQLVLASAHSVLQPRLHHPRLSKTTASDLLGQCLEGPTERGSFIASVIVPVPVQVGPDPLTDPYARRVTRMMMTALACATRAVDRGEPKQLLNQPGEGLSANFLEALAGLGPLFGTATIEASMTWSRARPTTPIPTVRIDSTSLQLFDEAARVLRARHAATSAELAGFIVSVQREPNDPATYGNATMVPVPGETESPAKKVRLRLSPALYVQAVDAHKQARQVCVTGTLKREGRVWWLDPVADLEELSVSDDDA